MAETVENSVKTASFGEIGDISGDIRYTVLKKLDLDDESTFIQEIRILPEKTEVSYKTRS